MTSVTEGVRESSLIGLSDSMPIGRLRPELIIYARMRVRPSGWQNKCKQSLVQ